MYVYTSATSYFNNYCSGGTWLEATLERTWTFPSSEGRRSSCRTRWTVSKNRRRISLKERKTSTFTSGRRQARKSLAPSSSTLGRPLTSFGTEENEKSLKYVKSHTVAWFKNQCAQYIKTIWNNGFWACANGKIKISPILFNTAFYQIMF